MIVKFSMCHQTATFLKRDENTNTISTVQNFHSMKKKQVFTPIVPPIAFNEFCKLPICTPSWTYTDSNCGLLCIQIYSIKLHSPTTDIRWWYKPEPIYCGQNLENWLRYKRIPKLNNIHLVQLHAGQEFWVEHCNLHIVTISKSSWSFT